MRTLASIANGGALPLAEIPRLSFKRFREVMTAGPSEQRIVSLFGMPEHPERLALIAVLARDAERELLVTSTEVGDRYPAITPEVPQAHLFEREIAEQWGVQPEGHPWLKPVRFHRSYILGRDAWGRSEVEPILPGVAEFFRVEGDEVHEVGVGPVHAGVIEPGHFRFQCHGERVIHLEIALGYQHRGVERLLEGGPDPRTLPILETVSGDGAVGHALAGCQLIEALGHAAVPPRARAIRALALELERLANHAGDLGSLARDVGYLPAASFCGRLRGDLLNLILLASGSRMGLGWIRPGGLGSAGVEGNSMSTITQALPGILAGLERSFGLMRANSTVRARFEETGTLPRAVGEELGVVGPSARASGLARDVRLDHPCGAYSEQPVAGATWPSGDVFGRARIRLLEAENSAAYALAIARSLPRGPERVEVGRTAPDHIGVSLVEGWRGEIAHVGVTDAKGAFRRYKIVDPSFHNWPALAMAMRDQPISDFPLCNKSFNLSYSGHDL